MNGRIEQPHPPPRCPVCSFGMERILIRYPDYVAVAWLCRCAPTAADLAIFNDDEGPLLGTPPFCGGSDGGEAVVKGII